MDGAHRQVASVACLRCPLYEGMKNVHPGKVLVFIGLEEFVSAFSLTVSFALRNIMILYNSKSVFHLAKHLFLSLSLSV